MHVVLVFEDTPEIEDDAKRIFCCAVVLGGLEYAQTVCKTIFGRLDVRA